MEDFIEAVSALKAPSVLVDTNALAARADKIVLAQASFQPTWILPPPSSRALALAARRPLRCKPNGAPARRTATSPPAPKPGAAPKPAET
jgi:hypothetical protein